MIATPPGPSTPLHCTLLHRDERLLVLDKPAGLLSVPGIGPANADCLSARVQSEFPEARIVHRLDQATSGVLVMARDAEAHRHLNRQFEQREVGKRYLAIVHGRLAPDAGEIDLPLRTDLANRPHQIVDLVHGKPALTRFRVLRRGTDRTRLELFPLTGRSHQLRVHLLARGHPILGDDLYAPPAVVALADRLLLHACALTFTHPGTGARVTFESEEPF